jgi:hypothetical protein
MISHHCRYLANHARDIEIVKQEVMTFRDRFKKEITGRRWDGEYRVEDRISSALFNHHVDVLCEFLIRFTDLQDLQE